MFSGRDAEINMHGNFHTRAYNKRGSLGLKQRKKKNVDLTQTGSSIYQSIPKSSISAVWDLHRIHMLNLCTDVQIGTIKNRWNHIWVSTAMTQTGRLFFLLYKRTLQKHKCTTVMVCKVPFKFFLGVGAICLFFMPLLWASLTNQSLLHSSWGLALDHASEQARSVSSLFLNQGWPQVVGLALLSFWLQASQSSTLILQYPFSAYMHIIIKNECLKYTAKWKQLWIST